MSDNMYKHCELFEVGIIAGITFSRMLILIGENGEGVFGYVGEPTEGIINWRGTVKGGETPFEI